MALVLTAEQIEDLSLLASQQSTEDVVELCKAAFEYLSNGVNIQRYELLASKFTTNAKALQRTVEGLVSLLIDATKADSNETDIMGLHKSTNLSPEILGVLSQFVKSKRRFIEGSIKSANLRSYRIVNIEWRLETKLASRSLLKQNSIIVTMKLYLHTEPKNENRDLLPENETNEIHSEERRNRKDVLVQTDLNSLLYIIQTLEEALMESKTRRIRNIIDSIH